MSNENEPLLVLSLVDEAPGLSRLEQLRKIVEEHQAMEIDGYLVDATTASVMCRIHDQLNAKNQAKFMALSLVKMVEVGWELVN